MPTVLQRIHQITRLEQRLAHTLLATGGEAAYDAFCQQVQTGEATLSEVTMEQLAARPPEERASLLPACVLTYRAELWDLHTMVNAAASRAAAMRVLTSPWNPQPRQEATLTHVVELPLLYRPISLGGLPTIFGHRYTAWY